MQLHRAPHTPQTRSWRCQAQRRPLCCSAAIQHGEQRQQRAVVLGSGLAGLATAHVLARHFPEVVVLERDAVDPAHGLSNAADAVKDKAGRRGVTQYNHLHVLAARGVRTMDALFDGRFSGALQQAGGVLADVVTGFRSFHPSGSGAWLPPAQPAKGPVLMGLATRHVVEGVTRRLVAEDANVEVLSGTHATGLALSGGAHASAPAGGVAQEHQQRQPAVTGVVLSDGSQLHADLVVDCSGRRSSTVQWLAAAGLPVPRVSRVDANLGYASWLCHLDPEAEARLLAGGAGVYVISAFPQPVGAAVVRVEDGMYMAAVCTYAGQTPPFDDAQLLPYVKQHCYNPVVAELLAGSQQLAPASRFYRVASTWRHFEDVQGLPEGLLVTGDAVCSFNPIYGHGMTVAALEAAKLDELLAQRRAAAGNTGGSDWLACLPREYQRAISPIIQHVWDLSVGGDIRFSSTTSTDPPSPAGSFMNAYLDILCAAAAEDPVVTETLLRVMHLMDDPAALMQPAILGRAALHVLKAPFRAPRQALTSGDAGTGAAVPGSGRA